MDYDGLMGVPVTFLERWNTDQFDVVDLIRGGCNGKNGKRTFSRVVIKNKLHPDYKPMPPKPTLEDFIE